VQSVQLDVAMVHESRDGRGWGDHDVPFTFGQAPSVAAPLPFSTRQFARLLILRGRAQEGFYDEDRAPRSPDATPFQTS
jgi:hypothetical protein